MQTSPPPSSLPSSTTYSCRACCCHCHSFLPSLAHLMATRHTKRTVKWAQSTAQNIYYAVANKYEQEPHSTKANMPEDAKHHNLSCYIMLSIEADDASIVPSGCFSGPIRAPPGCKSWHDVAIFIGYHRRSCHGSIRSPVSIPLWLKEGTVHWTLDARSINRS